MNLLTTILVINTQQDSNQALCQTLETNGYQVFVQKFQKENFHITAQQQNPDIILLDLCKSKGKAPEICQAVRLCIHAPIVVLSCGGSSEAIAKILDAGADDYLVKPISNSILFASIHKFTWRISHRRNHISSASPKA